MTTALNPLFQFEDAKREQCKASILIEGLTGKGKSGLALLLGHALAGGDWSKVFDIDTENSSLKLFAGLPSTNGVNFEGFKIGNFTPDLLYKPSHYMMFREGAIQAGAEVVINDSISHAWMYKGGLLDQINALKKSNARYDRDSYAAWGDPEIVAEKQILFQLLRDHRCHVISTVRVKEKMEYDKDEQGKSKLVSLGEQEIMQADIKYEPDLVLHMIRPGKVTSTTKCKEIKYPIARVVKSRYAFLSEGEEYEFTPELCEQLRAYLAEGTSPEELFEAQRQTFITAVTEYLNAHKNAVAIWTVIKEKHNHKDTKLGDLPLADIKTMFLELTVD